MNLDLSFRLNESAMRMAFYGICMEKTLHHNIYYWLKRMYIAFVVCLSLECEWSGWFFVVCFLKYSITYFPNISIDSTAVMLHYWHQACKTSEPMNLHDTCYIKIPAFLSYVAINFQELPYAVFIGKVFIKQTQTKHAPNERCFNSCRNWSAAKVEFLMEQQSKFCIALDWV